MQNARIMANPRVMVVMTAADLQGLRVRRSHDGGTSYIHPTEYQEGKGRIHQLRVDRQDSRYARGFVSLSDRES
jgi:hypothetical protein